MIAAALILILIAALLVLWILFASDASQTYDLSIGGLSIHVNAIVVFLLGAAAAVLVLGALRLLVSGTKRGARNHRERKTLLKREATARKERDEAIALREKEAGRRDAGHSLEDDRTGSDGLAGRSSRDATTDQRGPAGSGEGYDDRRHPGLPDDRPRT